MLFEFCADLHANVSCFLSSTGCYHAHVVLSGLKGHIGMRKFPVLREILLILKAVAEVVFGGGFEASLCYGLQSTIKCFQYNLDFQLP